MTAAALDAASPITCHEAANALRRSPPYTLQQVTQAVIALRAPPRDCRDSQ